MTVGEFLAATTAQFQTAGIGSARLDALILLEDALHQDRALLLAHPETELPAPIFAGLYKKCAQRLQHVPLAYIRGTAMFYGRTFMVNTHVLVPRPESEQVIELLKELPLPPKPHLADIGTGSGCLGITAALELPAATVDVYDIDTGALACAKRNMAAYDLHLQAYQEDLLEHALPRAYDVLLANLPYVPDGYAINEAAAHEPKLALFAGSDGLDLYRRFWEQLGAAGTKPAHVLTEALPQQHKALAALAQAAGYKLAAVNDFIQHFTAA